jgi:hypothetical protein
LEVDPVEAFSLALLLLDRNFLDRFAGGRRGEGKGEAKEDHYQEDW